MIFNHEIETMAREDMQKIQLERLQRAVKHAYENVPFHKEAFKRVGIDPKDVQSLEDVQRLPFMKKTDLRENYPFGLFAVGTDQIVRIHGSSGTKGKPTVVGYTKKDIENWAEIVARALCCAGGKPGDIFHNAYGYGLFTGGLGLHNGIEHMGAVAVPVSGGNTPRQITLIQDFQPRGIAGTPSYVLNIVEEMKRMGLNPRETSLRYGIFGAEPWSEEMRVQLEEALNIKAVDIYGLSEVMGPGVSIECHVAQDGLHIAEDHFLAEIVDPKTGEVLPYGQEGELVFTSLTKEAFPVIRYRTGDIASLHPEKCACGRTTIRMSRIKGRVDDMLIIRGVNVFPTEIESVLLGFKQLAPHYQVVIERDGALDRFEVHCEVTDEFIGQTGKLEESDAATGLVKSIAHEMKNALGVSVVLRVNEPNTIPRSDGKAIRIVDNRSKTVLA
ncbi:phenylacetate--CoA ligase family protein [Aneurinibacillus aneurinilyticus]|jgi:phenylacetate-CoA ligase|uniref:Phenylacetate-coenzyme A ligase n=1 Tax=Aneurinibacillus aneurinilyticus ATCC 12856 TaxID=649747 RepID=U1WHS0_ANEAE|nr:AMP-binding protein [Aneurinibacillus aneurinilyticus]ERI08129.1 putative phenylacetate-CoA ligase [Aneurinibacillus aneurinilyticus ATCC 12856]MCI1696716.1 AMP-binding protein [Aneurinibacillus aneurinilyticus]MED0708365.1 AMP-binding protein [Aneurinibacillus aneurinilyticus]MED0725149.1 AMP-binding protein [Aneurinibacillus aneurinilyticus]MED0733991.1 AMP-binding protein [Aneurinibacillus aneurinilyticus]